MAQTQFQPPALLQDDVKCFWFLEETPEEYNFSDVMPDSYIELIINCGAPVYYQTPDGETVPLPLVGLNRLQHRPLHLRTNGVAQFVAVRLYPWAVRSMVGHEADLNASPFVTLDGRWLDFAHDLKPMVQRRDYAEAIDCLQAFVGETHQRASLDLAPIRGAGELLYATQGQSRMTDLADHCALSPSQLDRRFKYLTGASPKMFARLVRFQTIRNQLMRNTDYRPADLAQDFGYSDQAHLIHDFKSFANCTPGEFLSSFRGSLALGRRSFPDHYPDTQAWRDAEILQYA